MEEDNISIRLKFLINKLGVTSSVFADTCGIARATLSQMLSGRNKKVSDVIISQIHAAYPQVSIMWLLFNEGPMWVGGSSGNRMLSEQNSGECQSFSEDLESGSDQFEPDTAFMPENLSKNASEISESLMDGQTSIVNGKEKGVNRPINKDELSKRQENIQNEISGCLGDKIEKVAQKQRKIVQITVYYDDSTFETLYPR